MHPCRSATASLEPRGTTRPGSDHTLMRVLEGTSNISGPKGCGGQAVGPSQAWGDGVNPKATASEGGIRRLGRAGRRAELGPRHPRRREAKAVARTCRREWEQATVGGGPRPRKVLHQPAHVRPEGQEARAAREAVPQSGLSLGRPRPALRAPP